MIGIIISALKVFFFGPFQKTGMVHPMRQRLVVKDKSTYHTNMAYVVCRKYTLLIWSPIVPFLDIALSINPFPVPLPLHCNWNVLQRGWRAAIVN